MNRRKFLKVAPVGVAAAAAVPSMIVMDGCSTSWIQTVLNDLPELVNIATSIISVIAVAAGNGSLPSQDGALINTAAQAFQASLTALQDAANAYNASKSSGTLAAFAAAITAVQSDASKVIAALPAGTVSTNVETTIVALMGTAITIISGIQMLVPGAAPAAATLKARATAAIQKPVLPNAAAIRAGVNAVLYLHGFADEQIQ